MSKYAHLHNHTQYSLLDGATPIGAMMDKAKADGQTAVAMTDHGNMFGAFKFVAEAQKRDIKPIIGCEFYIVDDRHRKEFSRAKGEKDVRYHQLLLAKNQKGYENLAKLCSIGYVDGLYSKWPRIDKEALEGRTEGLIATSCCLGSIVQQKLLHGLDEEAEKELLWWVDIFGEDYYVELQRHRGLENIDGSGVSQEDLNQKLIRLAAKHNIKTIVTNDSHYLEEDDADPHDILLCINTGERKETEKRFRFPSSDFFFKTQQEMSAMFTDVPEAVENTMEIAGKVEVLELARDVLLPNYPLPKGFETQDDYLRELTYVGAQKRYGLNMTDTHKERLDFELDVIRKSGYPGYFLIVQDFTTEARNLGVSVGPGRGSAAGSAVAYCLGITNVDPIKYDLLFERFLNPERVSMPDIDIDFDDEGRQKVIDYVVDKYGKNQVAQIITYGSMKAKSAVRDVGRVMDIPLSEVDKVAKSFPDNLSASLAKVLHTGGMTKDFRGKLNSEDMEKAERFRQFAEQSDDIGDMIRTAQRLEGSVRNTGIHACGVVITPDDITKYVPVSVAKDSDLLVSQFDNSVAEDAGLLKMDFLGLKTLTIIRDAIRMVKTNHGVDIDPDEIPLDDEKTYELFQRGETVGIFQYESGGMQKHLIALKPTEFGDLIAMNALYRPGPMQYIPEFCDRKHGRAPIVYDLPEMEEYLAETMGICVFQEQIMLLSQKLANFSKGEADTLRKAMGKKKKDVLDKMYPRFVEGCKANGHPEDKLEKIWKDWEHFAAYAFNKSHSTCYALVAFQTAYLKAHYPAEYMAAVLTHNKKDQSKMTFFLRECRRMGTPVLGPDVNESYLDFSVNKEGAIRFGMSAMKGVGEGPVDAILAERKNGPFDSLFDMMRRLDLRAVNKKVLESLALGGGFDSFEGINRAQYFTPSDDGKYPTFIEHALRYGIAYQHEKSTAANSLFGGSGEIMVPEPEVPMAEPWPLIHQLDKEKEVVGIYISGHPLDDYEYEVKHHSNCLIDQLEMKKGEGVKLAVVVQSVQHRVSKKGTGWGLFVVADTSASTEFALFSDDYQTFKDKLEPGCVVLIDASYKERWGREGEFQLKLNEVTMMESVAEKRGKGVHLQVPIHLVDETWIGRLEEICNRHKGPHSLRFTLVEPERQIAMPFLSKRTVMADTDFLREVQGLGVVYEMG
jgi:DNA polymerase-3 subunit alpha